MTNQDNQNKKEGLPDIAKVGLTKNPVLILIFLVLALLVGYMYFMSKAETKGKQQESETYNLTPETPSIKNAQPTVVASIQPVSQEEVQQQVAMVQEKQKELQQRLMAPLMLVNVTQVNSTETVDHSSARVPNDPNLQFMQQVSGATVDASSATSLGALNTVIAEGSLIHAVLESAVNSDLPGYLRANVSDPVYSEDGSQILIPVGSRLIGQYKSGMQQGQSRIFIVWTRLLTPSGLSLNLGSQGVDNLGVSGLGADEVDRHFWERFGTGSLLSLIGAGAANLDATKDLNNPASEYRDAVANSFSQSATQSLEQDNAIPPTLKGNQGKPIIVFVAKDLHFPNSNKKPLIGLV